MFNVHDTIIALASAPGGAIRGILRISGSQSLAVCKTISDLSSNFSPKQRSLCVNTEIVLPGNLPSFPAKLLFWPEGHSYTGDETVEIHTFGSPILLDAITAALILTADSVRLAQPGEFTLRAFLSGRLDLAQAEAVLGIIDAANDTDLKTALHQLAGNVAVPLTAVRTLLFETLAQLEASLDFAEEEISEADDEKILETLDLALQEIERLRQQIAMRQVGSSKPKIVLTGLPNAGKSTLFNKLLGSDAALVSPKAGTTRDYLEAEIDWAGMPVILIDTAGIGTDAIDILDERAQNKAYEMLLQADVVIHCYENATGFPVSPLSDKERKYLDSKTVFFRTKTTGETLDLLIAEAGKILHRSSDLGLLPNTALRCREALHAASESLCRAKNLTDSSLIALELRGAVNQLGLIDGSVHTEDILENIFSRFCIGK